MSEPKDLNLTCADCGHEITEFSEAVEALEDGCACPVCGEPLDEATLEAAVDGWDDFRALREGAERAEDLEALGGEEEWTEAGPDFGDDGEEDEDEE